MKRRVLITTAATMLAFSAQQTLALNLIPQLGIQIKNLNFEQKLNDAPPSDTLKNAKGDFSANIPVLSASVTVVHERLFGSLKYETGLSEVSASSDVPFTDADSDITREDFSITLGGKVWKDLSIFYGYMSGETEIEPEPVAGNLSDDHVGRSGQYRQTYKESGLYIGASYGWRINTMGTLSASLAYADMGGTYKDNYAAVANQNFKYEGESTGLSIGATWSAPINDQFGYYVDFRRQAYSMDANDTNGNFATTSVDTDEVMMSLTAGVQLYF